MFHTAADVGSVRQGLVVDQLVVAHLLNVRDAILPEAPWGPETTVSALSSTSWGRLVEVLLVILLIGLKISNKRRNMPERHLIRDDPPNWF